jgi:predicted short-subunit dehydrogenase-like oxidoreductase (DUF2520 family)
MSENPESFIPALTVVIIGTGAVASTLIKYIHEKGVVVLQQYGRSRPTEFYAPFTDRIEDIRIDADIYIIAVTDDSIPILLGKLPNLSGIVVHTAGSVGIDVFEGKFQHYGSLYPLQSFSKDRTIFVNSIPFIIEVNSSLAHSGLESLADQLDIKVHYMSFEDKLQYHLAAVFANNFTNHMYAIAKELLDEKDLDYKLLKPLMFESFDKLITSNPKDIQTGPAKRNDLSILKKQYKMLTNKPNFKEIYKVVSNSIADFYKK